MSGSVNKVIIVGNLCRDPETRNTHDGRKIVNMTVATSEQWKDKNSGDRKEKSEFHRVVIFNERLGEIAERYLRKGSKVYIEGALQTRKWQDQSGHEKYSTEIVLMAYRGEIALLGGRGDRSRSDDGAHDDSAYGQQSHGGGATKNYGAGVQDFGYDDPF